MANLDEVLSIVQFDNNLIISHITPSLSGFNSWENIPKFSIVTGTNGSGKSQLLSYIKARYREHNGDDSHNILYDDSQFSNFHFQISSNETLNRDVAGAIFEICLDEAKRSLKEYKNKVTLNLESIFEQLNILKECRKTRIEDIKLNLLYYFHDNLPLEIEQCINYLDKANRITEKSWKNFINEILRSKNYNNNIVSINKNLEEINLTIKKCNAGEESLLHFFKVKRDNLVIEPSSGEAFMISYAFFSEYAHNCKTKLILLDEPDRFLDPKYICKFITLLSRSKFQVIMTTHRPDTISMISSRLQQEREFGVFTIDKNEKKIERIFPLHAIFRMTHNIREITNIKVIVYVESQVDMLLYDAVYTVMQRMCSNMSSVDKRKLLSRRFQLSFQSSALDSFGSDGGYVKVIDAVMRENDSSKRSRRENKFLHKSFLNPLGLIDKDYYNDIFMKNNECFNVEFQKQIKVLKRYAIENVILDPMIVLISIPEIYRTLTKDNIDDNQISQMLKTLKNESIEKLKNFSKLYFEKLLSELLNDSIARMFILRDILFEVGFERVDSNEKVKNLFSQIQNLITEVDEKKCVEQYLIKPFLNMFRVSEKDVELKFAKKQAKNSYRLTSDIERKFGGLKQSYSNRFDAVSRIILKKMIPIFLDESKNQMYSLAKIVNELIKNNFIESLTYVNCNDKLFNIDYPKILLYSNGKRLLSAFKKAFKEKIMRTLELSSEDFEIDTIVIKKIIDKLSETSAETVFLPEDLIETFLELNETAREQGRYYLGKMQNN